jgi:hypothetical protein
MTADTAQGMLCPNFVFGADAYTDGPSVSQPPFHYGGSFLMNAVQAIQQQANSIVGPRDELKQYLESGAESTTDIISWWGVSLIPLSLCYI